MQIMQFTKDIRYEYDKFSLNYIIVGNFRTKLINQKICKKILGSLCFIYVYNFNNMNFYFGAQLSNNVWFRNTTCM